MRCRQMSNGLNKEGQMRTNENRDHHLSKEKKKCVRVAFARSGSKVAYHRSELPLDKLVEEGEFF